MSLVGADSEPATKGDVRRLYDRLDKISDELHERFVTESDLALVRVSVGQLQEWQTWAMRIILGAVLIALVGLVVTAQVPA